MATKAELKHIRRDTETMNKLQACLVAAFTLATAASAAAFKPQELMAAASRQIDLEKAIPKSFGKWTVAPDIGLVTPSEPDEFVDDKKNKVKLYTQELARGYRDPDGNIVMFLVAYGPVQNYRLKSHRPEVCYTAAGFRISDKRFAEVNYQSGTRPINVERLITERETRFEPVSYWRRVGDEIANGIFENQYSRIKYGLHGVIPDGALVRVSTVGLPAARSFKLQDDFIRDLLNSVDQTTKKFLIGDAV